MMIPKPKRIKDRKAIERVRKPYCELCGRHDLGIHVHHIIPKGRGGPDHRYNLISLCAACHTKAHAGGIPQDDLWVVIGRRTGMEPSAVQEAVRIYTRRAHVGEVV